MSELKARPNGMRMLESAHALVVIVWSHFPAANRYPLRRKRLSPVLAGSAMQLPRSFRSGKPLTLNRLARPNL
jgi:hypothetical protein